MDNWADNEALRHPSHSYMQQKPTYRRSLSELPQSQNFNTPNLNRRSLGNDILQMLPKSSTSMTDIQSSNNPVPDEVAGRFGSLNRSSSDISSNQSAVQYTYIGISGPDRNPIYQNQSIVNAHNRGKLVFDQRQHDKM